MVLAGLIAGCCRELHVHLGEKVYVTKAADGDGSDRQGPNEILDEVIDDLTSLETNSETPGKP